MQIPRKCLRLHMIRFYFCSLSGYTVFEIVQVNDISLDIILKEKLLPVGSLKTFNLICYCILKNTKQTSLIQLFVSFTFCLG